MTCSISFRHQGEDKGLCWDVLSSDRKKTAPLSPPPFLRACKELPLGSQLLALNLIRGLSLCMISVASRSSVREQVSSALHVLKVLRALTRVPVCRHVHFWALLQTSHQELGPRNMHVSYSAQVPLIHRQHQKLMLKAFHDLTPSNLFLIFSPVLHSHFSVMGSSFEETQHI